MKRALTFLRQPVANRIGLSTLMLTALWIASAAPAAIAQTPTPPPPEEDVTLTEQVSGGGQNIVQVMNRDDQRMRIRGNVDLNRIPGDRAAPVNYAAALASCTDCQTFAIALQIDLISRTASAIAPQNTAIAVNVGCTRCVTVARAIQFVVQVDDPREVPENVRELVREMDRELREIAQLGRQGQITLLEAETRINALIDRFRDLGTSLYEGRDGATEPTSP